MRTVDELAGWTDQELAERIQTVINGFSALLREEWSNPDIEAAKELSREIDEIMEENRDEEEA